MARTLLTLSAGLLMALWLVACSFSNTGYNCSRYKQGSFIYHVRLPEENVDFLINREGSIQTEINQKTGAISKLAIKWTGECKYELRLLESTEVFPDSIQQLRKRISLVNTILQGKKDYYVFRAERAGSDFVLTDTLWVKK